MFGDSYAKFALVDAGSSAWSDRADGLQLKRVEQPDESELAAIRANADSVTTGSRHHAAHYARRTKRQVCEGRSRDNRCTRRGGIQGRAHQRLAANSLR